ISYINHYYYFSSSYYHPYLHSFPTRRSSDLDRDRHSNNRNSNNRQDEYDVSKEAADRIVDEVAEIERAYVLTTKNNAYVAAELEDRKSTRLNSSHVSISYAVFCLKKKKNNKI